MSQQLRIWQDSTEFYQLTSQVFRRLPYELKRVGSQAIAASDSVHRKIAEGVLSQRGIDVPGFAITLLLQSRTRLATRLQSWARNFKRVRVDDAAGFAAKIIQNVLHRYGGGAAKGFPGLPCHMRRQNGSRRVKHRIGHRDRQGMAQIHRRSGQSPGLEGVGEILAIDHAGERNIDQPSGRFHQG